MREYRTCACTCILISVKECAEVADNSRSQWQEDMPSPQFPASRDLGKARKEGSEIVFKERTAESGHGVKENEMAQKEEFVEEIETTATFREDEGAREQEQTRHEGGEAIKDAEGHVSQESVSRLSQDEQDTFAVIPRAHSRVQRSAAPLLQSPSQRPNVGMYSKDLERMGYESGQKCVPLRACAFCIAE